MEVEFDSADPSEATTGMHCLDSSYQKYTLRNGACGVPSFVVLAAPVTNGDWCGQALDWSTDPTYIEADQAKCTEIYIQQDNFAMPCKYVPSTADGDGPYECKGGSNKTTYLMC